MRRRDFLKLSGVGVATLTYLPSSIEARTDNDHRRQTPTRPIVLENSQVKLILDSSDGLPYEYVLKSAGNLQGEAFGQPIVAILADRYHDQRIEVPLSAPSISKSQAQVQFRFNLRWKDTLAGTAVLRYRLEGCAVFIDLTDVEEENGFELIELRMPSLATVDEQDPSSWLAHADTGGSLAYLREATAGRLPENTFWGKVAASLPVVMIGNSKTTCVQEVTAFMDGTELSVVGNVGSRVATLGTVKSHRVDGSLCYDMNTGSEAPRSCGTQKTPNLLVGQMSSNRLDFVPASRNPDVESWLPAAQLVRARMPKRKTDFYNDKFVYGIHCDEPKYEHPRATFSQCEELIGKVAKATDQSPQVVHLWGWQYHGKDTGYPAIAEVNPRLGGYDALQTLIDRGRELNATVTFSDNYDDAYRSSPAWDPQVIARRPDGELWKSRNWTGEDSYIVGMAKYMAGPGTDRVRYTCDRYRLRDTTHVDVLTYFSVRNDWDPARPASGVKNLTDGRYKVLDEFAKRGIDVSSEAMRYAFIGKVTLYWHMPRPIKCPFGGKPIPLMATIYRQSAIWGEWGRITPNERILTCLFYSTTPHAIVETEVDFDSVLDSFYLLRLPWSKVHVRQIESFQRLGPRTITQLEGNSKIDLDWEKKTYSVVVDGSAIADTGSTFCPVDKDRIAFYSIEAKELTAPLPKDWDDQHVYARVLSTTDLADHEVAVKEGRIVVRVESRRPLMVYRRRSAALNTEIRNQRSVDSDHPS